MPEENAVELEHGLLYAMSGKFCGIAATSSTSGG
jgi:hypothetical protein